MTRRTWDAVMAENARRRSARHRRIAEALRENGRLRGVDLASLLSVSKRTVYRDIEEMKDIGLPVAGAAGYGYILRTGRRRLSEGSAHV